MNKILNSHHFQTVADKLYWKYIYTSIIEYDMICKTNVCLLTECDIVKICSYFIDDNTLIFYSLIYPLFNIFPIHRRPKWLSSFNQFQ